ncbi:ABC-type transporter Mla MlaB component [Rhodopseudomonas thermotolerans]|uniref:ABC-type transporter Mla MlaB component n=2 Tax=Rhodopseudomonas TaxID=1073 RepID=A0A336JTZ0_9BRAD|nr:MULTISPECIES: STAS domain-containing protein [Rhodopseudomonas]RED26078.1 ABC-type transporter Mla MlaB component [Rhodopseudomonas pentothenatexigens]REF91039.1 ABC-type transporter Mla MlaB component [Rhodopseudomonas thermotolerans]SSW93002.1 ABC-type transporter Mla MlaB component [Rhodopseudomonas pentothenatexigens]
MTFDPSEAGAALRLPSDCSISSIRTIHETIQEALGRQGPLEIDCSNVNRADLTAIQLLLSTAKTGEAQGRPVVLTELSEVLRNTMQRAGFADDEMIDQNFPQKKGGS